MAGYDWDRGMSNNAVEAYQTGELPASKAAKEYGFKSAAEVRRLFDPSSWHHTSKFFNCTDFFNIEESIMNMDVSDFCEFYKKASKVLTKRGKNIMLKFFRDKLKESLVHTEPITRATWKQEINKTNRINYLQNKYGRVNKRPKHLSETNWEKAAIEIKSLEFYEADTKEMSCVAADRREFFASREFVFDALRSIGCGKKTASSKTRDIFLWFMGMP